MLEKFFKPKWQHNKPEVRKQALLALNDQAPEHINIFSQVAREDKDAAVRRVAINRLHDLGVLKEIAETEGDADIQDLARKRFFRIVAGIEPTDVSLATRLEWVELEQQGELLESFARQGKEPEIRLTALTGIRRESLLGDLAIGDADAQVRIAAAQRLTQQSTMSRVAKHSRSRDKKVYLLVQGELDRIKAEQEKPERISQDGRNLCAQLETLCKAKDMLATVVQQERVQQQWQKVLAEWDRQWGDFPADLEQRYRKALEQYTRRYQEFLAEDSERREQDRQFDALRQHKRAICDSLEHRWTDLNAAPQVDAEALTQVKDELVRQRQAWSQAAALPREEEAQVQSRFRQLTEQLNEKLLELEQRQQARLGLDKLYRDSERLRHAKRPIDEQDLKKLRQRLQEFDTVAHLLDTAQLDKLRHGLSVLQQRYEQQLQRQAEDITRFQDLVTAMEQELSSGNSAAAAEQQRELRQIQRNLSSKGKQQLARDSWINRFHEVNKQLDEIRDWKRWSGTPHKEALVQEMEQLATEVNANPDATYDIEALAAQVRAARDEWKRLGEIDPEVSDQLWGRFNNACNTAYAPCEQAFKQQADERRLHLQQKEIICDSLESFINAPDFADADWSRVDRILKTAQLEWRNAGVVNRKEGQALGKRFKLAMDTLRASLDRQLEGHGTQKSAVVQELRELLEQLPPENIDAGALNQALARAKQLQAQWKSIGRARKEKTLWQEFRTINDRLFSLRGVVVEAQQHQLQEMVAAREAIIANIEELSSATAEEFSQQRSRFEQARRSWEQAPSLPKEQLQSLNTRFRKACRMFEEGQQQALRQLRRQQLDLLERKSDLCCQLERILAAAAAGAALPADLASRVEAAQRSWQDLATGNDEMEEVIQQRFQRAVEAAAAVTGSVPAPAGGVIAADPSELGVLCARLELLAEIDTPEKYREQRMQYQLTRLAEKMRGEDLPQKNEFNAILRAWYACPCVADSGVAEELAQRFLRARDCYLDQTPAA